MYNIVTARKEVNNMILTITREEVEKLIREKYNLPNEVKVYITDGKEMFKKILNSAYGFMAQSNKNAQLYYDTDSVTQMQVTVNKENQVQDVKSEPLPKESRKYPAKLSKEELDAVYERYADTVEEFIKSGKNEQFIDCGDRSPSTMRYRYNTAIKMYGFDEQCYASATDHNGKGHAKLVRKGKVNA